jgi:methionyl-tRNA synthetase
VRDLDAAPDDESTYPVITGEYSHAPPWRRHPVAAGTAIAKPTPVFTKLDPSVVDEELRRLEDES